MKRFVVFTLLITLGSQVFAQQLTEIRGKLGSKYFKEVGLYKVINGRQEQIDKAKPAANGSFSFVFKSAEAGFYTIGLNRQRRSFKLYLKPGDKANVVLTDSLISFSGINTKENIALGEWEKQICKLRKLSFFYILEMDKATYKEIFPEAGMVKTKIDGFLRSNKTGNREFDALMAKTVAFDFDHFILISLNEPRTIYPKVEDYPDFINSLQTSTLYNTDDVLKHPYGVEIISRLAMLKIKLSGKNAGDFNNILTAVGGVKSKGELVIGRAERFRSYKEFSELETENAKYLKDADQKERMEKLRIPLLTFKEGNKAYDFTYPDSTGKEISLSDFKGKVVLVDVWATWCGPCKKEIPSLMEMEKAYHGKNIVFMGVSVDEKKDYQKWKAFLKEHNMAGVQLFAEGWSKIIKDYKIKGIPRFMLFDKKGNIITVDAPRPSDPKLKVLIDEYLSK